MPILLTADCADDAEAETQAAAAATCRPGAVEILQSLAPKPKAKPGAATRTAKHGVKGLQTCPRERNRHNRRNEHDR